jgi:hypothetical protein
MQVGCWNLTGADALSEAFIRIPLENWSATGRRLEGGSLHVEVVPEHFQVLLRQRLKWAFDS